MKYIVTYVGEWRPNPDGNGDPVFQPSWTKEYSNIDDIEIFFKKQFEEMVDTDTLVTYSGPFVWQIQK